MPKDPTYHESAVTYNNLLATAAEDAVDKVEDEEVKKWCKSVAKQHRFHEKRHESALSKLLRGESVPDDVGETHIEAQVAELTPTTVEVDVVADEGKDN